MPSLTNQVALVTGAARGTGRAIALALGQAAARVVVVDVNPDGAQQTADAITQAGGAATAQIVDVSNKMAVQTMLYAVIEQWGRIDIVVNAAHVAPGNAALKMDEWEWNRTLDVNLKGAFLISQTAARAMRALSEAEGKETSGGLIINVLRPAGATPHAGVRAARAGLAGLTVALDAEWSGFGVRVATVEGGAEAVVRRCFDKTPL
jgi:NAD(P)-dependent dehydrogenase (short-subunit alcohol dehydrogenase family)